jgi:hypothetical protein
MASSRLGGGAGSGVLSQARAGTARMTVQRNSLNWRFRCVTVLYSIMMLVDHKITACADDLYIVIQDKMPEVAGEMVRRENSGTSMHAGMRFFGNFAYNNTGLRCRPDKKTEVLAVLIPVDEVDE